MNDNPLYNRDYSDGPKPAGRMCIGGPLAGRYVQMSDPQLPFFQVPEDCGMMNPHLGSSCDPTRMVSYVYHLYHKDKCKDLEVYVASTVRPEDLDRHLDPLYEIRWADENVNKALQDVATTLAAFEESSAETVALINESTDIAKQAFEQFGREVHKVMQGWDFNEYLADMVERNRAVKGLNELEALVAQINNHPLLKKD